MIIIKGGPADKAGLKCSCNPSTIKQGNTSYLGVDSMLAELEREEEEMNEFISNPRLSRKGKVY